MTSGTPEKRMAAHHEQVEHQHGEPEEVVIRGAVEAREILPMKLGRRVFGHAHAAPENARALGDLERVAVDEGDDPLTRDHHVLLVDVADDVPVPVDRLERDGAVSGGVEQEPPVGLREILLTLGDAVEVMNFAMVDHPGHQDAVDAREGCPR